MSILHKYVFLTGDFNARTQTLDNFLDADEFLNKHFDFDESMQDFYNASSVLLQVNISRNRSSQDKTVNNEGRSLLEVCKSSNLFMLNGRCGKDKDVGPFTFKNVSVIDYSILSTQLLKFVSDFEVVELDTLYTNGHSVLCTLFYEISGTSLNCPNANWLRKKVADLNGKKKKSWFYY